MRNITPYSFRVFALFLVLLWLQPAMAALEISEHQVTSSTLYETTPTLGNDGTSNLVVYTARELLNTGMFDQADIYYHYLDETGVPVGSPLQVTASLTDDVLNDVSGDYIVYTAFDDTMILSGSIMLYRISTGQIRALGAPGLVRDPKIHGHYVVWLAGGVGATEVILYDINTNVSQSLAGPVPYTFEVQIGSRFAVWSSLEGDYDIEVFDFELEARYFISATASTDERYPSTAGDWIGWQARDVDSPLGRIEVYNGRTGEMRIIVDDGSQNRLPSVSDGRIAWEGNINGNFDVFMHRLDTSETFQITSDPGDQYLNDFFGKHLVAYVDRRSGDEDIYVSHVNQSPIAVPGVDQTANRGVAVTLDGSGSSDPDEDYPLSYQWKIEFAPGASTSQLINPTEAVATFIPDVLGYYTISLTVTDEQGGHGGPEWVVISTENVAPVADAGPDQVVDVLGTLVQLNGSQSYDPDGDDLTFSWVLEQEPVGSSAVLANATTTMPSFYVDVQGDYIVRLTVADPYDALSSDTMTVSFNNLPPVANAGTSQSAQVGQTVGLDGNGSYDPNGDALTFKWILTTVPAGSIATIATTDAVVTSFIPDVEGLFIVQLKVNDGQVDSEPGIVQVQAINNQTTATDAISDVQDSNAALDPGVFKNKNMQSTMSNKLNAVLSEIANGDYADALNKLENDILKKTNGCANAGAPDKNDWIKDCESQAVIYPLIMDAIEKLQALLP